MQLLQSLVDSPAFASTLLGAIVPAIYRGIQEAGVVVPDKLKVWMNLGLSTLAAFLPLALSWIASGIPSPEQAWASIAGAFVVSEVSYRQFFKAPPEAKG